MAVVANEDGDLVMQDPLSQDEMVGETGEADGEIEEDEEEIELKMEDTNSEGPRRSTRVSQSSQGDSKLQKDMETCFGFDEVYRETYNSIDL